MPLSLRSWTPQARHLDESQKGQFILLCDIWGLSACDQDHAETCPYTQMGQISPRKPAKGLLTRPRLPPGAVALF